MLPVVLMVRFATSENATFELVCLKSGCLYFVFCTGVFFSSFQFTGGTGMVLASLIYTNVSNQVVAKTALFSVMLGVTVVGLILFCSLRQVKPVDKSSQNHPFASDRTSSLKVNSRSDHPESTAPPIAMIPLSATLKQAFCDPPMALLVPIIFYNGMIS